MNFGDALKRRALIAEFKRHSPFTGTVNTGEVEDQVRRFEKMGASAISIIVDPEWNGSYEDLRRAARVTSLPILAKSLLIDPAHALDCGASAVLTFDGPFAGVESVVEVHTQEELQGALDRDSEIILINNRSLQDGSVDTEIAARLVSFVPEDIKVIAASGYRTIADAPVIADGVLIGTALAPTQFT